MVEARFSDVIEGNSAFWVISWLWLEVGTEGPCSEDGREGSQ